MIEIKKKKKIETSRVCGTQMKPNFQEQIKNQNHKNYQLSKTAF